MKRNLSAILVMGIIIAFFVGGSNEALFAKSIKKPVTIKILHYMGNQVKVEAFNAILKKYQTKNPSVNIEAQSISQSEYFNQLRIRIASGDVPDIMMGQPSQYPDIIKSGYVMDLSGSKLVKKLKLSSADIGDSSYNGILYGLPLDFKTYGIFYNKDIFKKYKLKKPTTQAELNTICKTLKAKGVDPWIRNYSNSVYPDIEVRAIFWPLLMENGKYDALEKLMSGKAKFTDYPEFRKALNLWRQRLKYNRNDDYSNDITMGRMKFAAGQGAMMYEGTWAYAQIVGFNPDLKLGMFPIPSDNKKSNHYCIQLDEIFMVNGKSSHVGATMDFMSFLLSPEIAGFWTAKTLSPSVVPGVSVKLPDVMKTAMKAKESGKVAHAGKFTLQFYGEYANNWRNYLQAFAADKNHDVDQCINKLQTAFDEIIKSSK
jgi:raffinose/stachyose/melibiose transport system substrate-binding protein